MEELEKYPIVKEFPVQWGDMDAAQHVNNLIYLKWAESARIYYFDEMEMDTSFRPGGTGPIMGWQECKYIFPMTFPDTAIVGVRTCELRQDRFLLESAVYSKQHQRIACISKQSVIPYDYEALKKAALPDEWINSIQKIEKHVF